MQSSWHKTPIAGRIGSSGRINAQECKTPHLSARAKMMIMFGIMMLIFFSLVLVSVLKPNVLVWSQPQYAVALVSIVWSWLPHYMGGTGGVGEEMRMKNGWNGRRSDRHASDNWRKGTQVIHNKGGSVSSDPGSLFVQRVHPVAGFAILKTRLSGSGLPWCRRTQPNHSKIFTV